MSDDRHEEGQGPHQLVLPHRVTVRGPGPVAAPDQQHVQVQQPQRRVVAVGGSSEPIEMPLQRFPDRVITTEQIRELDIPTFIRRQMD